MVAGILASRLSKMASADWEFVFDGVVGFLTSPIWQIPVMNFIEKNCIGIKVQNFLSFKIAIKDFLLRRKKKTTGGAYPTLKFSIL